MFYFEQQTQIHHGVIVLIVSLDRQVQTPFGILDVVEEEMAVSLLHVESADSVLGELAMLRIEFKFG